MSRAIVVEQVEVGDRLVTPHPEGKLEVVELVIKGIQTLSASRDLFVMFKDRPVRISVPCGQTVDLAC